MSQDYLSATTAATKELYEAGRGVQSTLWAQAIDGQALLVKLARNWLDETQGLSEEGAKHVNALGSYAKAGREAGERLAHTYFAAGLASLYYPFAFADQALRPAVEKKA